MIIYSNFDDLILIIYNATKKVHSLTGEEEHGALIDLRARPPQVKTYIIFGDRRHWWKKRCWTIGARTVISVAISKHQRFLLHTDSSLQLLISWQTCLRAVLPRKHTPASRAQQVSWFLADIVAHWDHSPLRDRLWFGYSSLVPSNNPSSWRFGRGQFFEQCPIQVRTTPFQQTQSIFLACTRRMYLHTQWSSIFH